MPKYVEAAEGVVKEVNECRGNPPAYAYKVEHLAEGYKGVVRYREEDVPVLTLEGLSAVSSCLAVLRSSPSLPPLQLSPGLSSVSQLHCRSLGLDLSATHNSPSEAPFLSRLSYFGQWHGRVIEMLDFGSISPREVLFSLLVDDGLPTRDHQRALLSPDYRYIGVGFGPHEGLKSVCTVSMAKKFTEKPGVERVPPPGGMLMGTWEARGWLEGAVRLDCEITTEADNEKGLKRVVKRWEMDDGSERKTEEVIYDIE